MPAPAFATCLWYDGNAEAAARRYCEIFPEARIANITKAQGPDAGDRAFLVELELGGQRYTLLNGGPHFKLNEAVSIMVTVDTQADVDRLWAALTEGGAPSQCGWLRDAFGLSWQVVPEALPRLVAKGGAVAERVLAAMMTMGKLDVAGLEAAAKG